MHTIKTEDHATYSTPSSVPDGVAAAVAVIRAHLESNAFVPGRGINGSQDAVQYLLAEDLFKEKSEVFAVMYMDTRHRLISLEKMFRGSVDRATVHPREIIRRSLELNAAALILSHNHPSGDPTPSNADIELTERLVNLCKELDIRVLDHIVVAGADAVSMAEKGYM